MTDRVDPAALLERLDHRRRHRDAADVLDVAAGHRLPVRDDRQRLHHGPRIARRPAPDSTARGTSASSRGSGIASRSRSASAPAPARSSRRRVPRATHGSSRRRARRRTDVAAPASRAARWRSAGPLRERPSLRLCSSGPDRRGCAIDRHCGDRGAVRSKDDRRAARRRSDPPCCKAEGACWFAVKPARAGASLPDRRCDARRLPKATRAREETGICDGELLFQARVYPPPDDDTSTRRVRGAGRRTGDATPAKTDNIRPARAVLMTPPARRGRRPRHSSPSPEDPACTNASQTSPRPVRTRPPRRATARSTD